MADKPAEISGAQVEIERPAEQPAVSKPEATPEVSPPTTVAPKQVGETFEMPKPVMPPVAEPVIEEAEPIADVAGPQTEEEVMSEATQKITAIEKLNASSGKVAKQGKDDLNKIKQELAGLMG